MVNKFLPLYPKKGYWGIIIIFVISSLLGVKSYAQNTKTKPLFSAKRGFYNDPFDLSISSDVDDVLIHYTLDGTDPRTSPTTLCQKAPASIPIDPTLTTRGNTAPNVVVRACIGYDDSFFSNKDSVLLSST